MCALVPLIVYNFVGEKIIFSENVCIRERHREWKERHREMICDDSKAAPVGLLLRTFFIQGKFICVCSRHTFSVILL